jgi:tetratricopeptide (TPR) repeat protein
MLLCFTLLPTLSGPLQGQQTVADSALAVARSGRFDSALTLLTAARHAHPDNPDLQMAQARVLGWAGRRREAIAAFDSLLHRNPSNVDALVGLGYAYYWDGREDAARRQVRAALRIDSTNADALALQRAVRRLSRGAVEASANWSNDSDRNTNFWQTLTLSAPIGADLRILATGSLLEASDPLRDALRVGGEAGLGWWTERVRLSALAGARRLDPDVAPRRTEATYRANATWRPKPEFGVSAGYARYPFDDIASLFEQDITIEALEGGVDTHPASGLTLAGGGGALWFSDGNRRTEGHASASREIGRHVELGVRGQALGYRQRGVGYFSPDRFHLLEGTGAIRVGDERWDGRLSGGLGGQQIGRGGDTQTEWHIEGRVGRNWGDGNRIEGFGGVTNSAVSSTTGAFRYRTAGLLIRLGL